MSLTVSPLGPWHQARAQKPWEAAARPPSQGVAQLSTPHRPPTAGSWMVPGLSVLSVRVA